MFYVLFPVLSTILSSLLIYSYPLTHIPQEKLVSSGGVSVLLDEVHTLLHAEDQVCIGIIVKNIDILLKISIFWKKLEDLGIGRPSTFAMLVDTIVDTVRPGVSVCLALRTLCVSMSHSIIS
jgi:hypothetical protein